MSVAVPHCLGVQFVGVAGRELKNLLQNISLPFSKQAHSDTSVKSTHSSVGNLTVGHCSMAVTWQSRDSPVPSDADDCPAPVSAEVTSSSATAIPTDDHPTAAEDSPLPTHGLQY